MQSDSVLPEVKMTERYTKSGQAKQDQHPTGYRIHVAYIDLMREELKAIEKLDIIELRRVPSHPSHDKDG